MRMKENKALRFEAYFFFFYLYPHCCSFPSIQWCKFILGGQSSYTSSSERTVAARLITALKREKEGRVGMSVSDADARRFLGSVGACLSIRKMAASASLPAHVTHLQPMYCNCAAL